MAEVFYICRARMDKQHGTLEKAGQSDKVGFCGVIQAPDALLADGLTLDDERWHFCMHNGNGTLHHGT